MGDASNHDEFINDNLGNQNNGGVSELEQEQTLNDLNDLGDDYDMNQFFVPDINVLKMSPSGDLTKHNIEDDCDDDLDEHHDDSSDKYLENLSDSSSEDEDEDEDIGETNKLKRVPTHNDD